LFSFEPARTAVLVVDMQNDYGADGGMFATAGLPIDGVKAVVAPIREVLGEARDAEMLVVYLTMQFEPDLSNFGAHAAPNRVKHERFGVGNNTVSPNGEPSRVLIADTWNTEILPELAPEPTDVVVAKHRYSGFFETELDEVLRQRGVDTLIVTGCTTSICVEATIRDAFYRDFRCLLLSDCTAEPLGNDQPRTNYDASLLNVEALFGWVSDSSAFLNALRNRSATTAGRR
jgi:ureidoacrylate peracid hydrolase